jgi:hypothetical protein
MQSYEIGTQTICESEFMGIRVPPIDLVQYYCPTLSLSLRKIELVRKQRWVALLVTLK